MRKLVTLLVCSSLPFVIGCAAVQSVEIDPAQLLTGTWDNNAQMASVPQALKRPPVAGGAYEWIDGQVASFFPVTVPALTMGGGKAMYLVWRSGAPSGPVSRQRLWVFRTMTDGQTGMDFYAFKNPQPFELSIADGEQFKAITVDDLTAYGPLCTLPVIKTSTGWSASIPQTCAITARSGRKMVLSARIVLDGDTLSYSEAGILETGVPAFKVPGGPAYQFDKMRR